MSKKIYSQAEIQALRNNPNVKSVTEKGITYSSEFKIKAIKQSKQGMKSTQIFELAGLPSHLIGKGKSDQSLSRWKRLYKDHGEDVLLQETRGSKNNGPYGPRKQLSLQEVLDKANARIAYLEGNLELIKKLEQHKRSVKNDKRNDLSEQERFRLINQIIRENQLAGMVNHLCDLARVSKSGYYYWLNSSDKRAERDRNDWEDFQLLYRIFLDKKKCGIDEIKMALETEHDVVMNHKKIRRILRKNDIISSIRAAKPYRKMMKVTQENATKKNLVNRQFDQGIPYKVFLTDITYLPYGSGQWAYLSAVKDGATGEIVAHHFSTSLKMNLVYETLDKLNNVIKDIPVMERYIHSDQGVHYTYPVFQEKVLYRLHPSHLDSF
ncbi:IS3 family transposase [Enterococcus lactis]|mgnify:FL=1|uniref:IS3 family transposase n=1 Tax=Enterococcus lactis TaxID=357441 RepID=UPI001CDBA5B5|nr:IS3 family transposase [Enterococcus lactis]UBX35600.1 IS3 family transposase [Enterococcus lactis]UBX35616.1 IS3 family transposase [Enterococcus lactis]